MEERESVLLIDKSYDKKDNARIKYLDKKEPSIDEISTIIFYALLGKELIIHLHDTIMPSGIKIENYTLNYEKCSKLNKL